MKLWVLLFGMIWVVVAQFLLALFPLAGLASNELLYGHAALGAALVALGCISYRQLSRTRAPPRIQRVARASLPVLGMLVVTGPILFWAAVSGATLPGASVTFGILLAIHVVAALAILAHATAVAVSYDVWEDEQLGRKP